MKNYGETLAYWYLRLNGFFPVANLVVHKERGARGGSGDIDIVAIRPPFVTERVGGMPCDWDVDRFQGWGLDLEKTIGLIVEVKTGTDSTSQRENIALSLGHERTKYGLGRIGFWQPDGDTFSQLLGQLDDSATAEDRDTNCAVGKLLIADHVPCDVNGRYLTLQLREAWNFIQERIAAYSEKFSDRHRFSEELIQYMI